MALNPVGWSPSSKIASSLAGLAVLLLVGELALRAAGFVHPRGVDRKVVWSPERDAQMRAGEGLYRFDPLCLWSPRPGAEIPGSHGERINPDGFRGPQLPIERTPGVLRIAALGGQATLGVGMRWEDTYCARLVQILGEMGVRCEILCAGAEEHSVVQGLERWRHVVRVWQPQLVICTYVGGPDHTQAPQGRMDARRIALMREHPRGETEGGLRDAARLLHLASYLRDISSGVYWEERDWAFQERRIAATSGELDWPGQRRVPYDEYVYALTVLMQDIQAEKATVILLSIPRSPNLPGLPAADVYQKTAADAAHLVGSGLLDGRNALVRSVMEEEVPKEDMFQVDGAISDCSHLAIAQALAEEIVALGKARR